MAAWFTNMQSLHAEYMRRLENIDVAFRLGLYDSEEDRDTHKVRTVNWYNDMSEIMQPARAA
jgi:hypothetical protein